MIRARENEDSFELQIQSSQAGTSVRPSELQEVTTLLREKNNSDAIKPLVLSSEGKNFCTGLDLNWLKGSTRSWSEFEYLADFYHELLSYAGPTIALVNGKAIGGGVGFAIACDFVLLKSIT